jgi:putative ABC transport system permease protein
VSRLLLWLRWSWRDLRARALQVGAIAAIVALGTGVYAGLSSTSEWRRRSYPASYAALDAHEVRVTLADDSYVGAEALRTAITAAPGVDAVETRLVAPTQVDASRAGETILVPGRLVGLDVGAGAPRIDRLHVVAGAGLPTDGSAVVVDEHFADHHRLPASGRIRVAGGREVAYAGRVLSPEYFLVMSDEGTMLAEATFAVVFAPLPLVEELTGRAGKVNDAVVRLAPGTDRRHAAEDLEAHLRTALPGVAATVTALDDERAYRVLFDDIEGDQRLYDIFAVMILGGAAFAAFNLAGRIVQAQRREIGIGMSLGVPRWKIAVRPALVGLQVALLGALLGVGVGLAVNEAMRSVLASFFPLPEWHTPFESPTYLRGLLLGIWLPFTATLLPVWRAVRVAPVDAIRTGPHARRRGGLGALARHVTVGNSIRRMPLRNVLRAPRRTLLTALAIAAAIGTLVGVIGMVDSFLATIDQGERAVLGGSGDRLTVELSGFAVRGTPQLTAITDAQGVAHAEPGLRLPGTLRGGDEEIETLLRFVDFDSRYWRPGVRSGSLDTTRTGIVLAEKAARDLGVGVGDTVSLRHPRREGSGYRWVRSDVRVEAIHAIPYRFVAFFDVRDAGLADLDGVYNTVALVPEAGTSPEALQRTMFTVAGVASAQPVQEFAETIRDAVTEFLDILDVVRAAVLVLALLIAFNAAAINVDERAREHATMFAFGVPVRTVIGASVVESVVVGILGSVAGIAVGQAVVTYVTRVLLPTTLPDISIEASISPTTIAAAAGLGIVAVALAPLLTVRRLRRMDIPATLRVVE